MGLPTFGEELLVDVATDGFTLSCRGPKTTRNALAAIYEGNCSVNLLTIHDLDRVTTEYVAHFNDHRPHRTLNQAAPLHPLPPPPRRPSFASDVAIGSVD